MNRYNSEGGVGKVTEFACVKVSADLQSLTVMNSHGVKTYDADFVERMADAGEISTPIDYVLGFYPRHVHSAQPA